MDGAASPDPPHPTPAPHGNPRLHPHILILRPLCGLLCGARALPCGEG